MPDTHDDTHHLKYIASDAATIGEVAVALREHAGWLERLEAAGFRLREPVDGAWMHFSHPEGHHVFELGEDGMLRPTVE